MREEGYVGWVYFIRYSNGGDVKIGYSGDDPQRRLKILQTGCPDELTLIGVQRGTKGDEAELHERFAEYRKRGEWFRWNEKLAGYIARFTTDPVSAARQRAWLQACWTGERRGKAA
jgi:hypothetical protein